LKPQLGVVRVDDREFVMADLPGLIEGASEGAGLGHRFLAHVERCAVILHLVDATEEDVVGAWRTVRRELKTYGNGLDGKQEITALSKSDAVPPRDLAAKKAKLARASRGPVLTLSGVSGAGVPAAMAALLACIDAARAEAAEPALAP
jgi:GTP-binding protein